MPKNKKERIQHISVANQSGFSALLFDTLFGLIMYFAIAGFLDIHEPLPFLFYLFSLVVVVHWWLLFKASDDLLGAEVADSVLDIVIGIVQIIFLEYFVLLAQNFSYVRATWFLVGVIAVGLFWGMLWRFVGKWRTRQYTVKKQREFELTNGILVSACFVLVFGALVFFASFLTPLLFCILFFTFYILFVILTFTAHVIDLDWY